MKIIEEDQEKIKKDINIIKLSKMFKLNLLMKILSALNNLLKVNTKKNNPILHAHLLGVKLILLILSLARDALANQLRLLLFTIKPTHL
jgi:hypothetical protein